MRLPAYSEKGGDMWIDPQKRQCYGSLFPDLSRLEIDESVRGGVFKYRLNSLGIGVQAAEFSVDEKKWERCIECPHYRTCYDLSMAKLALGNAVGRN